MPVDSSGYLINISREEMKGPMRNILFWCFYFKWLSVTIITHTCICSANGGVNSQGTISILKPIQRS